ncbi:site-specific integrase [Bacillus sp. BRMEA1]|uniref:site-specific integrase n=1 Tax=Neobacillus endophyticus TaxID=2738405 RepID=UPI0015657793|nr:site-specific integrase [Neobacillus endophyticus]NRD77378.1 site-specific integrase [Neobacillus endophyticus]
MASIVYQVAQALTEINFIGQSKKDARKNKNAGIHSIKQIKETLSAAQNFGKWVRDHFGVLSIYELKEEHYTAYMEHLKELGRSIGHQQNVETALGHLQKAMNIRSKRLGYEAAMFVPDKRITNWRELKKAEDRSYSQQEFESLLPFLSANVRDAVLLERFIGLRVREACYVLVHHFKLQPDGTYKLKISSEEAGGITKGGRYRITPVPTHFTYEIKRLLKEKSPNDRMIPIEPSTVRKGVNRACKRAGIEQEGRGTHGFRHLYCRDRLSELLVAEHIEIEGKMMLERIMSNRDVGRKADYGILTDHDKEIYRKLKSIIDTIHEEIGHGEDRWDLAERYLR